MTPARPYRVDWLPAGVWKDCGTVFTDRYPVGLRDGSCLELPLIALPGDDRAIALLMANQTSFQVERKIVERLAVLVQAVTPDTVVGIPTLGLTYARPVAELIGLPDFVALGYSRKFWYDEVSSEATVSSTSPGQSKRIYLDPGLLERVQGRRVVVVDDVLNTGSTMTSAITLLHRAQAQVAGVVVVLTEGWQWQAALARIDPHIPTRVAALGHIPMFRRTPGGWVPLPETEARSRRQKVTAGE